MYLQGVIVCVNYSDFLAHTLPHNKHHFDELVIVTDLDDAKTRELCEFHHVRCLQTDVFYENGDSFNKGAAIAYGLSQLSRADWVMHLDADIYLPPMTRTILNNLPLERDKIYGADRLMCPNYESWARFIDFPRKIQEGWIYIHTSCFPMGVRLAEYMNKGAGWEPIGYLQLWNPNGSGVHDYPTEHDHCDRTDVLHCKKFPRERRELLPEIIVIHIESEGEMGTSMGKNWRGRKTRPFELTSVARTTTEEEIKSLMEQASELVSKHNLSYLDIKTKNRSMSLWRRLFTDGVTAYNDRRSVVRLVWDRCKSLGRGY